jgi:hypothetical protein
LPAYPGLIVKASYWRWPERNLAGNAIDFHVQVLGMSFHDAMRWLEEMKSGQPQRGCSIQPSVATTTEWLRWVIIQT